MYKIKLQRKSIHNKLYIKSVDTSNRSPWKLKKKKPETKKIENSQTEDQNE